MTNQHLIRGILSTSTILLILSTEVNAFTSPQTFKKCVQTVSANTRKPNAGSYARMRMSDKNVADVTKTPGKKVETEAVYDEVSGSFVDLNTPQEDGCERGDEFCVTDKETGNLVRLTIQEKERIFLDALQSYYINGRQLLNDDEFDVLKEDLVWNGSPVAVLNRKEATYLNAVQAYLKGEPIISDEEFDTLKKELKEDKSQFAVSKEPKCLIDTGICTVTLQEDQFRTNLLYLPVAVLLFSAWLGVGFEIIEKIVRLNPLVLIALGAPLIYKYTIELTEEYIFKGNKIVFGPCPSCEKPQRIYFGDILGVEGFLKLV